MKAKHSQGLIWRADRLNCQSDDQIHFKVVSLFYIYTNKKPRKYIYPSLILYFPKSSSAISILRSSLKLKGGASDIHMDGDSNHSLENLSASLVSMAWYGVVCYYKKTLLVGMARVWYGIRYGKASKGMVWYQVWQGKQRYGMVSGMVWYCLVWYCKQILLVGMA